MKGSARIAASHDHMRYEQYIEPEKTDCSAHTQETVPSDDEQRQRLLANEVRDVEAESSADHSVLM